MVVAANSSAQIVQRYEDNPSDSRSVTRSSLRVRWSPCEAFPQTVQIHRAERSVVQAVTRLPALAPDHPPVIGSNRPVEADFVQRRQHRAHVDIALIRWVRGLLEGAHASALDVATVGEMNSALPANGANDFSQVIRRIRGE